MRTEVIDVSNIDEAAQWLLEELKKDYADDSRSNVIYFDGWDGLGAAAVLRRVAGILTRVAKADEPVFYIDCSKWESRRAMQRMIAEQLKLPDSMMEMFESQDEEDDFQGVAKSSRTEIPNIARAINQHIQQYRRFLLIFQNGGNEEINLNSMGFLPFDQYSRGKVLWSFQGRFRAYPRTKIDGALKNSWTTDVLLSANSSDIGEGVRSEILRHEAEEVAQKMINADGIDWPAATTKCFLYMVKLCHMVNSLATEYDLATHIFNYLRCDGIIQLEQEEVCRDDDVDKLWLSYDAMQREMLFDVDKFKNPNFPSMMERSFLSGMAYWTSPTYGFILVPDPLGQIPDCMFKGFDKLCVLKISACRFSFTSPPFLCCNNLRFLWLDHCRDDGGRAVEVVKEDTGRFFQKLWVLDVRYSNKAFLSDEMMGFMTQLRELNVMGEDGSFDMDILHGRMNNIRKLRVTKSNILIGQKELLGSDKLEFLEFSGNFVGNDWLLLKSTCSSLETVVICGATNVVALSFTGCVKLKNIFLSGSFPQLRIIEIIDAAMETLDLSAVTTPNLNHLYLRACGNICSVLWSPVAEGKRRRFLNFLHIDTSTQKEDIAHATARQKTYWHISISDSRILRSLEPIKDYFHTKNAHIEISSPTHLCGSKDNIIMSTQEQLIIEHNTNLYGDIAMTLRAYGWVCDHALSPMITQTCPSPPDIPWESCYINIEDCIRKTKSQVTSITLPGFVCDAAKILHVHNGMHITRIFASPLASTGWKQLEWCRVEDCPNLECVFHTPFIGGTEGHDSHTDMFRKLRTVWASHLPKARYIWESSSPSRRENRLLQEMMLLHIDYCPRLISIINVPTFMSMENLETLEIMWCGDLNVAFRSDLYFYYFPKLKHIRLHELPIFQNIVDIGMVFLELETIRIRGCWSFRKLPRNVNKVVECDCEKEWWDRLIWRSAEHAAKYKPTHPRHYKTKMLKGSVLR